MSAAYTPSGERFTVLEDAAGISMRERGTTLDTALEEALSVLQAGGAEARRQLLDADALHALATPSAAFLWATSLEATEDTVSSVSTMATAIVKSCSDIAAVLFASALGL